MRISQGTKDFDVEYLGSVYAQWLKLIPLLLRKLEAFPESRAIIQIEYDQIVVDLFGPALRIYLERDFVFFERTAMVALSRLLPEEGERLEGGVKLPPTGLSTAQIEDIDYRFSWMVPEAMDAAKKLHHARRASIRLDEISDGMN